MRLRRVAPVALSLVCLACSGSGSSQLSDADRAERATLRVSPAQVQAVVGVTAVGLPGSETLRVTADGLEGDRFLGLSHEGAAVSGLTWSVVGDAVEVDVSLATADTERELTGSVTVAVCADEGCAHPIRNSPFTVPVTVQVRAPALEATPSSLTFAWTRGTAHPQMSVLAITDARGLGPLYGGTVSVAYEGAETGWLLAGLGGGVPGALNVTCLPDGLAAGTHRATVRVEAGVGRVEVPVRLDVASPDAVAVPAAATFSGVRGAPASPEEVVVVLSSADGLAYQVASVQVEYGAAASGWLELGTPPLAVPGTLTLRAAPGDLLPGTYGAEVVVRGLASVELARIPVAYTVSAPAPAVIPTPAEITFRAYAGEASLPAAAAVTLSTPFAEPVGFGVEVQYEGVGGWLQPPAPWIAPTTVSIRAGTTALAPGTYRATVRFTGGLGQPPLGAVGVTYVVAEPLVELERTAVNVTVTTIDGPPLPAASVLLSTGGGVLLPWESAVTYDGAATGWLDATAGGTAPGTLALRILRNDLPEGTHRAQVHVRRPGGADYAVIQLTYVIRGPYVTASPEGLTFTAPAGASAPPPAASVALASADQAWNFTVDVEYDPPAASWLQVTTAGAVPGMLSARPSTAALPPGTYTANITLRSSTGGGLLGRIPVTYAVLGPPITTSPATVTFDVGPASTAAALEAAVALDDGGTPRAFRVAAKPAWLTVAPTSGTTGPGTTLALGLDLAAAGGLAYEIQGDLVLRVDLGGGTTTDVAVPVTARVDLPGVESIAPWTVVEGDPEPLLVRGTALERVAPGSFRIGGSPVASLVPASWTEAAVTLPPGLAAGRHEVRIVNALGFDTGRAELVVVPAGPAAPASGTSAPGPRTALVRDDARGAVYAANAAGWVERWRDANGLAREALALPGLRHLALTPDGGTLVAFTSSAIWEIDPEAFTSPAAPAVDLSWLADQDLDWRCGFANDGVAICANAGAAHAPTYRYVRETGGFGPNDATLFGAARAGVAAARDGSRVVVLPAGATAFRYASGLGSFGFRYLEGTVPAAEEPVTDRTSHRILPTQTGAAAVYDEDARPLPGALDGGSHAVALSDDGTRAVTVDGTGRIRVWDLTAPVAGGESYPEVGTPGGVLPPVSPGTGLRAALSVDGRTLYLLGHAALVVLPLE